MKKLYFGLLLLCLTGFVACESGPNNNNAVPSPSPRPSTSPSPTIGVGQYGEKAITILITGNETDKPAITVTPDSADLTNGEKAQWLVINESLNPSTKGMTVKIDGFTGQSTGSTDPFGPDPCENKFVMNFVETTSREISDPPSGRPDTYKYNVTLLEAATGAEIVKLDPQIIVARRPLPGQGGGVKATASPSASPKASPAPTKK